MSITNEAPKKSNLWKWLAGCGCLVVLLGILAIAGSVWFVTSRFTTDPVKARKIADSIVRFELPDGYEMKFGGNILGFKIAAFGSEKGEGEGLVGLMMFFPESWGTDRKKMEAQMDQQAQQRAERGERKLKEKEEEVLRVRSEDVKASRMVYVAEDTGKKIIQVQFFLDAEDGTILIQVEGKEEEFDEGAFEDFLDSIK